MPQYLLSVQLVDDGTPPASAAEMQPIYEATAAFNDRLRASGAWVFAGGLHPPATATVVRVQDGETLITDGPFAEGKEYIGGFWVIKAQDLDAALGWAAKGAEACGSPVEVRPFQEDGES
jgi:hypothetical protein